LLPAIKRITHSESELVALIKPQYETTKVEASRARGVITDQNIRLAAIEKVLKEMKQAGFEILARMDSVVAGAKGNIEQFVHARRTSEFPATHYAG
jgi:predicted rRNA methylase YqxC with S4 and FtsJ domains